MNFSDYLDAYLRARDTYAEVHPPGDYVGTNSNAAMRLEMARDALDRFVAAMCKEPRE